MLRRQVAMLTSAAFAVWSDWLGSLRLDMTSPTRRLCRLAGEVASLGLLAGILVGVARSWLYLRHGFGDAALYVLAAHVEEALLWALAPLLGLAAAVAAVHLATRGWTGAPLFGLALFVTPVLLWAALWINVHWLPSFLSAKSLAWNAVMTVCFALLMAVVARCLHSRWQAAGRPAARSMVSSLLRTGVHSPVNTTCADAASVKRANRNKVRLVFRIVTFREHISSLRFGVHAANGIGDRV